MKSMVRLLAIVPLALVIAIAGCGDDENPVQTVTVVDTVTVVNPGPEMLLFGAVYLYSGVLNGYVELFDQSSSGVRPDSVVVGDNVISDLDSWYWSPDDNYYAARFWRLYDSSFTSGDTVTVKIYYGSEMAMVSHKVMDQDSDSVIMVSEPTSPITRGSDVELAWNSFEEVDFYGMSITYEIDTGGGDYVYMDDYWATTDTMVTIPGTSLDYVGAFSYSVYPYRGPVPTAKGVVPPNINTPSMKGHLWTYGNGNWKSVPVSTPPTSAPVDNGHLTKPEPDEILRKVVLK